jgi:2-oxoglutarate dehydrogenase E2 component (dihydrolipoamide succinyltransferase)
MSVLELKVPSVGESITEVTLSRWLKKDGEMVAIDEPICEFESDKATLEFPAEAAGKLQWVAAEGDDLKIGALVARIDTSASAGSAPAAPPPATKMAEPIIAELGHAPAEAAKESYAAGLASPAAAKLMAENQIVASAVTATGVDGRIRKEDVVNAISAPTAPAAISAPVLAPPVTAESTLAFSRNIHREKMSRMRRTIAGRLVSAKNNTAMLTTFNEVDMSALQALRTQYQDRFVEKYGIKLGFMSLFSKACAKALMEMPMVNAHIDGEEVIYHDFVDISVAISTPSGLVVPPVRNVESLSLADIEKEIKNLAEKARSGKLTIEEMTGGTFTITNGGVFGSLMSTPILNEPQSAILGMHAVNDRPVAVNGQVVIKPMMYLAMSYDHRIIDGSTSVTFLVKVKKYLEDPMSLMLGL